MPTYKGKENQAFVLLPVGDYQFEVTGMESGLQTGSGKTAGSPYWEMKLSIIGKGATVFERLIDHPVCDFKIDTFLRSTGAAPPLGQAFEFMETAAAESGCAWIDPIGLRGWCHLIVDDYTPAGEKVPRKKNKVGAFLTDRPKIARAPKPEPEPAPAAAPEAAPGATAETEDDMPF